MEGKMGQSTKVSDMLSQRPPATNFTLKAKLSVLSEVNKRHQIFAREILNTEDFS